MCSDGDILKIAQYDFDWRSVGKQLLSEQKVSDIDINGGSEQDKRDMMLLEWKRTESSRATYKALVDSLRYTENNLTADRVEKLVMSNSQGNK